jgi:hypothetical protein
MNATRSKEKEKAMAKARASPLLPLLHKTMARFLVNTMRQVTACMVLNVHIWMVRSRALLELNLIPVSRQRLLELVLIPQAGAVRAFAHTFSVASAATVLIVNLNTLIALPVQP